MAFPQVEELTALIRPVTDARGFDIEAVKTVKAGKKSQVVIAVSGDDAPTLDQLEDVSNELSELFDAAEERGDVNFGAGYTLEVTTPGVDLPLTELRHWRRNRGRLVKVDGDIFRVGALDGATGQVVLVVPVKKGEPGVRVVPISDVSGAVVEIEFNTPPVQEIELAETPFGEIAEESTTGKDDK
ncbi:ribosome maturation factor RimP [Corynebacterium tuscaniense]|uniref:ribosome maturation factor RimP n=1 Tax=Corynebacterium tuscaniense TaxID=302449 RepID=UPI00123B0B59|nr:ribosome maturation factor RimP [Corynebacterium tuscaniense]KAA8746818.1 ribosome maturation factor RimP [Corynebacterium tuscaniense]